MIKVLIIYFVLIVSSPLIVSVNKEIYTVNGWLAIGLYQFDLLDGLFRSAYFFFVTFPVIIALYLGAPQIKLSKSYEKFYLNDNISIKYIIYFFILFSLVAWTFDLGINGFEKDTGIWRLSGIVYYIRSYISVIFVTIYIYQKSKPSLVLLFLYSIIVGYTSASRFTAITPLVLYIFRELIDNNGKTNVKFYSVAFLVLVLYSTITFLRTIFYVDDYTFSKTVEYFNDYVLKSDQKFWFQGINQLFLRIGIGRDVILSYEVAQNCNCNDYLGLFLKSGSCFDPPFDFYGLTLESNRFYLAPPQLSSLFVISNKPVIQSLISILYAIEIYFFLTISKKLCKFPFGDILILPIYFFISIFAIIGPIQFCFYIISFLFFFNILFKLLKSSFNVTS